MDRRLLGLTRPIRVYLFATVGFGLLGTVAVVLQMVLLSRTVDAVFLRHESLRGVAYTLASLLAVVLLRAISGLAREMVAARAASRAKSCLRERLYERLMALGPIYANNERAGELTTTATEGVERLDAYFGGYLPQVALSVAAPLLIAGFVFVQDWISGLLLLLTAPIIPVLMVLVGSFTESRISNQWLALSRMSAYFLDVLQGLPTLKVFGRETQESERVRKVSEDFRVSTMGVLKYAFLSGLVLEFMTTIAIALIAVMLGVRLLSGHISFESAFLILLLTPEFYRPLRELGVRRHAAMEGKASSDRIFRILQTPAMEGERTATYPSEPEVGDSRTGMPRGEGQDSREMPHLHAPVSIEFRGVSYAYPNGEASALRSVDLQLPAGKQTALVGRSGAGKSTIANLLMRFAEPSEGTILANGLPIQRMSATDWRRHVALVPQRPHLFYGTVLDNLRMGRQDATHEEIVQAAELAGAAEFMDRLPHGYGTQLGERGARLSSGQAQRIAIARAFLKNAPILVLDEPTSSLDPESEIVVREALSRLAEGRTVLVIAHRLNTVRMSDQIVVLDSGGVAETGTHEALLEQGSMYSRLMAATEAVVA